MSFLDALGDHAFLRYALLAGVLASIPCGVVGSFVVIRRISYIAGGIAHSVLAGLGVVHYLQVVHGFTAISPMGGAVIAALLSAAVIGGVSLRHNQREDTVIGAVWAMGMATGIVFISLTPGYTTDLMSQITDTLSGKRAFISQQNLDNQKVISLNFSAPFSIAKWWNVFANASVYNTTNKAYFEEGKTVDISRTSFNIYQQHTFTLSKALTFEMSGWYNSPGIWGGNFASDAMWAMDAGLSAKVLQGRGRFKVSVSDIFISQRWRGVNNFGDLYMDASGGWESRQLRANFSYSFGNQNVKQSRRRQTGIEDEKNRVGSDNSN